MPEAVASNSIPVPSYSIRPLALLEKKFLRNMALVNALRALIPTSQTKHDEMIMCDILIGEMSELHECIHSLSDRGAGK